MSLDQLHQSDPPSPLEQSDPVEESEQSHRSHLPIALTIAGSDSGGGAGIQADLKTFHTFGVYGTSAITAITAQNTLGVHGIHTVSHQEVRAQIDVVVSDLHPQALKTGMLANAVLVGEVAAAIETHALGRYVMDPVMVSTSGTRLLDPDTKACLVERLMPLASLITPNLHEAAILVGEPVETVEHMSSAAKRLVELGAGAALIKGGHLAGDAVDLLWDGEQERVWRRTRIDTPHTHGTGCTLSAAVTAGLALGASLHDAVDRAIRFVVRAIESAPGLGGGHGPLNHSVSPE
jgi:hydroxymethylpyrimidine/phosphomethylpyrimidine kinase